MAITDGAIISIAISRSWLSQPRRASPGTRISWVADRCMPLLSIAVGRRTAGYPAPATGHMMALLGQIRNGPGQRAQQGLGVGRVAREDLQRIVPGGLEGIGRRGAVGGARHQLILAELVD